MKRFRLKSGKCYLLVKGERVVLRPGEVVACEPHEIAESFRDLFEEIPERKAPVVEKEEKPPVQEHEVRHKGGGWYDVFSRETGEKVNEDPLRKLEAHALAGFTGDAETKKTSEED